MISKAEKRKELLFLRTCITNREEKEYLLMQKTFELVKPFKTIFTYVSIKNEVDTKKLIQKLFVLKNILVPETTKVMRTVRLESIKDLSADKLGNLKSGTRPTKLIPDCVIVPLLGFNENCYRIGYGGGFYDRYLAEKHQMTIGLAFDEQLNKFEPEKYDIPLNYIVTPTKTYRRANGEGKEKI